MSTRTPQTNAPAVSPAEKAEKMLPDCAADHTSVTAREVEEVMVLCTAKAKLLLDGWLNVTKGLQAQSAFDFRQGHVMRVSVLPAHRGDQ